MRLRIVLDSLSLGLPGQADLKSSGPVFGSSWRQWLAMEADVAEGGEDALLCGPPVARGLCEYLYES
jgi:hypothetical protein